MNTAMSGARAEAPFARKSAMTSRLSCVLTAAVLAAAAVDAAAASADEVADFYQGKTVTIVVGEQVGTGFDTYSRLLAQYLPRHIPGNPAMLVQNMVGASGLSAANWLYNIAPKDGTAIATFVHSAIFEPIFGNKAAKFDPAKFTWIGNADQSVGICGVSRESGIGSFEELRHKQATFGGTGKTGPLAQAALAVKNLLGAKIKLVAGYSGSGSIKLAISRNEVQGICGLSLSTVTSHWRDEWKSGAFKIILQLSGKKNSEIGDVPHVDDFFKSDEDRRLSVLVFGLRTLGRTYVAPPDVPVARKNALREAFTATMKDAHFLAAAAKTRIDITPMSGEEVEAFIAGVARSSPAIIARAKDAYRTD
jgi:tripartite-type tricarboxylate transporter receptor subunit TctC